MTLIWKNVYIDKLDDKVNEFNNTYHTTIKIKPIDVKSSICNYFGVENNDRDPKFETGDHVRAKKYEKPISRSYTQNWSEEVLWLNN